MDWVGAIPEFALLLLVTLVPGIALVEALGFRSLESWLISPAISVGILAILATWFGFTGIPWSQVTVTAALIFICLAIVLIRFGIARRLNHQATNLISLSQLRSINWKQHFQETAKNLPINIRKAQYPIIGLIISAILAAAPMMRGIGYPTRIPQSGDEIFHLNAVRFILNNGDANSFHLNKLVDQVSERVAFYPGAWHAVVALASVRSVVVASNVMVVLVAAVIWPLSLAALARALYPKSPTFPLFATIIGVGFLAFPLQFFNWGVLWPNALSYALVPSALAATVMALRSACMQLVSKQSVTWAFLTICALVAVGLAQPNGLLVYAIIATPFIISRGTRFVINLRKENRRNVSAVVPDSATAKTKPKLWHQPSSNQLVLVAILGMLAWCAGWLVVWGLAIRMGRIALSDWHAGFFQGTQIALFSDIPESGRSIGVETSRVLLALLFLGIITVVATRGARWLLVALGTTLILAGLADDQLALSWITNAWWGDVYRMRANVVIVSVLLTAFGLATLTGLFAALLSKLQLRQYQTAAHARDKHSRIARNSVAVTSSALIALLLIGTDFMSSSSREELMAYRYVTRATPEWQTRGGMVTDAEMALLDRLGTELDEGLLLGVPYNGSALAYAVSDIPVVFPHIGGTWAPDARYLGQNFANLLSDPEVCAAINRLGVRYFYWDANQLGIGDGRERQFTGLPTESIPRGLELVDYGGTARVYRITACD